MLSDKVFQYLKRRGIPLDQNLLKLPEGFRMINPTSIGIESGEVLVLGPVSRCYLTGRTATIWKSLPDSYGITLESSSEAMSHSAETISALMALLQLGLIYNKLVKSHDRN